MKLKIYIHIIFLNLILPSAHTVEHWDIHNGDSVPWTNPTAMTIFQNKFIVAGSDPENSFLPRLWLTEDGIDWTSITPPNSPYSYKVELFTQHRDNLYGFAMSSDTFEGGLLEIIRSADGLNWEILENPGLGIGKYSDAISFGNYIFVSDHKGRVWRSDGIGPNPAWSRVNYFYDDVDGTPISFAINGSSLCAAKGYEAFHYSYLAQTSDGTTWTYFYNLYDDNLRAGVINYGNDIFWGGNRLQRWDGRPNSFWEGSLLGPLPTPFILNNQVHAYNLASQILARSNDGSWNYVEQNIPTFCVSLAPAYHKTVEFEGRTYALPCDLISIKNGIYRITQDTPASAFNGSVG
jgi:hypothetical protein